MPSLLFKIRNWLKFSIFVIILYATSICNLALAQSVTNTFIIDDSQFQEITDCLLLGSWDVAGNFDSEFSSGEQQMYDDGTHGDQVPGDHIWTLQVNLVVDYGANTWEWSAVDGPDGSWLVETVYEQFLLPDDSPQTLTFVREGYATPGTGVTWTLDDLVANSGGVVTGSSPDYVTQNTIVVSASDSLTIPAGNTLNFEGGELRVFGDLWIQGLTGNVVTLTSNKSTPNPDDWFAIHFKAGSSGRVDNTKVEFAHYGVWCDHGGPDRVYACLIENVGNAGLFLRDLSFGIFGYNTIRNCAHVGIYGSEITSVNIDGNEIYNCNYDGIELYNSTPNVRYNIIYNNADEGIECKNSSPSILNNTIDNNGLNPDPSGTSPAGIEFDATSLPEIKNNIITNNSDHGINNVGAPSTQISYNDVWNHTISDYLGCSSGTGDISEDPRFVDPSSGNYFLQSLSPCIDTGDPASALDPDGTRADMGAYYFYQVMHFVPVDPTGRIQSVYIVDASLYGEQLQSGDEIAVLDGDLVVGAVKIVVLPLVDPITVYLEYTPPEGDPLPGAQDGNDMLFKIWDRSVESEIVANISEVVSGIPVFSEGTSVAVELEAWSSQTIVIRPAFLNLISFNMVLSNPSAEAVFDPLPNFVIAQDDDGNVRIPPDVVFPGHPGSNTIDANGGIKVEKGYNVYISGDAAQTLEVTGSFVDLSTTPIPVYPSKLNKISFLPQQFMFIQDVFSETVNEAVYTDLSIVQDHDGYVYIPPNIVFPGHPGSNTIDANGGMQPGKGYMLYHRNSQELSFTYPSGASAAAIAKVKGKKRDAPTEYFKYTKTGDPHSMFLKNINVALEMGDELGVFAGETCVGGKTYMGDLTDPLTIWCALPDYGLAGVEEGDKLEVHVWKRGDQLVGVLEAEGDVEFRRDRVLSLIEIRSTSVSGMAERRSSMIPKEMNLGQNYPNPFNPTTTIEFHLNKTTGVNLLIYDIGGKVVKSLVSGKYSAGRYRVNWNGMNEKGLQVANGIYIYRMKAGSYVKTKKMIIIK